MTRLDTIRWDSVNDGQKLVQPFSTQYFTLLPEFDGAKMCATWTIRPPVGLAAGDTCELGGINLVFRGSWPSPIARARALLRAACFSPYAPDRDGDTTTVAVAMRGVVMQSAPDQRQPDQRQPVQRQHVELRVDGIDPGCSVLAAEVLIMTTKGVPVTGPPLTEVRRTIDAFDGDGDSCHVHTIEATVSDSGSVQIRIHASATFATLYGLYIDALAVAVLDDAGRHVALQEMTLRREGDRDAHTHVDGHLARGAHMRRHFGMPVPVPVAATMAHCMPLCAASPHTNKLASRPDFHSAGLLAQAGPFVLTLQLDPDAPSPSQGKVTVLMLIDGKGVRFAHMRAHELMPTRCP